MAEREFPSGDRYLQALRGELQRAHIVPAGKVPPDVITMNSRVLLYDLELRETEEYTLVYPEDADITLDRISVLAPVGTAILGYRVGDVVEWYVPAGLRRLRVEAVVQQARRNGVLSR
jgi:regulator of nucleoside diphosphate kinase